MAQMFLHVQRKLNKLIVGRNRDEFDLHVKHLASKAARLLRAKTKSKETREPVSRGLSVQLDPLREWEEDVMEMNGI